MNPVQQTSIGNTRYSIGLCYAIIPEDVERDKYVADCKRRGRLTILTENGDIVWDCPVGLSILDKIEFPLETGQLGSQLVYNNENKHNKPIIVDRILKDDESLSLNENEFRFERSTDNGSVSLVGVAKEGNLYVNVFGNSENGGKVYIDVGNSEESGEIVVNLKGDLNIELNEAFINVLNGLIIKAVEDINIFSTDGVINLGEENLEPLLKGTETVSQLNKEIQALTDLLNSIGNITPIPVTNGYPDGTWYAWKTAVGAIVNRGNLSNAKSEKTFTQ